MERQLQGKKISKISVGKPREVVFFFFGNFGIYFNLVTRPKKGSANTLVLPHGSEAISEACVTLCA